MLIRYNYKRTQTAKEKKEKSDAVCGKNLNVYSGKLDLMRKIDDEIDDPEVGIDYDNNIRLN